MNINIIYNSSVNNAPAGFKAVITAAVQFLDATFSNTATINIDVGWGEVDGQSLGSNALGESIANYTSASYTAVRNALLAESAPGASTLPLSSPLSNTLSLTTAEAKALGLLPSSGSIDGFVGFSSIANTFSFSAGSAPPSSEYYLLGVVEHEITEDMGRVSTLNSPMDLYRYSSPGVRSLHTGGSGSTAYFSIDNGTTNLGSWNNNPSNGDLGDWYPSGPAAGGYDAFNDYSNPGVINVVSGNDITLMDAIGWGSSAASLPAPAISAVTESPSTGDLKAGKTVTINLTMSEVVTVTGTPSLTLNDGGTATFSSGSNSNTLSFNYAVAASDTNVSSLAVAVVNLNGGTILDGSGNSANLSLAGISQIGPQIDTSVPLISAITDTPTNGQETVGNTVTIKLNLSEAVTVTGAPILALNDGGTATYTSGSGSSVLSFSYTVGTHDTNVSSLIVTAVNLGGGTIEDGAGNNANLSLTGLSQTGPKIDTIVPTVQGLVASADNLATNVNAGHAITITATMNEALTVTGTPTLQLNDNEVALYTSGSGTSSLTFTYTVQPGDSVSDLFATGLNLPSGATIVDSFGNALTSVTGDLHLTVNATTPPATTVQQEIVGLYAALYGRAADFTGYSYWVGIDGQQPDSGGVTITNAGATAITLSDAQVLGQLFVNTQSAFFNATYGALTDSQFINALYVNIGGNAGDPGGMAYWANLLAQAEATGESVQTARAGLVGQFVHDLIDINLSTQPAGLTTAQYQAALMRQATIDNKIAVSLAYANASQQPGGSILVSHTAGDSAYNAAVTAVHAVTNDGSTADIAIAGIQLSVAQQNLLDIV